MVTSLLSRLLIIAACFCAWSDLALAERKVAIVIGNSSYEHSQPLKNPVNDTKAVSDLFKQLGYEVQLHLDVDRAGFTQALGDFHQVATSADAAVFYYAGHGVSVDGRNYLIPVDSNIQRVTDVKLGAAIDAELAIEQALADAKVKLVFLDACRDNPFVEQIKRSLGTTRSTAVSSGLAEMKSGAGTLIAFSTAPGQVALDGDGDKSPFAEALLKHLSEPGLEVRLAMTKVRADVEAATNGKQTPWESTNLTGFYYVREAPTTPEVQKASEPPPEALETASDAEIEYWRSVKDSNNIELLKAYLTQFPNGLYASIAAILIDQIGDRKATSSLNERQSPEREAAQQENRIDTHSPQFPIGYDEVAETQSAGTTQAPSSNRADNTTKNNERPLANRQATKDNKSQPAMKKQPNANSNSNSKTEQKIALLNQSNEQPGKLKYTAKTAWNGDRYLVPQGSISRLIQYNVVKITYRGVTYQCVLSQVQRTVCKPPD